MSFEIIVTPPFEKELKQLSKKYPSLKKDIAALGAELLNNPKLGVPLGNDCYKIRMAITSKGRGKSGGARVITHVKITATSIFLLSIYDKAETSTITDEELMNRLKRLGKK
jgi:mRNA-degrading endonuclease RelE of RelBE toxin-antitoxin system